MKYIVEESLSEFKAWGSAAKQTMEWIAEKDYFDEVETFLEEACGEDLTDVGINDILAYDTGAIYDYLGLNENGESEEEREEIFRDATRRFKTENVDDFIDCGDWDWEASIEDNIEALREHIKEMRAN